VKATLKPTRSTYASSVTRKHSPNTALCRAPNDGSPPLPLASMAYASPLRAPRVSPDNSPTRRRVDENEKRGISTPSGCADTIQGARGAGKTGLVRPIGNQHIRTSALLLSMSAPLLSAHSGPHHKAASSVEKALCAPGVRPHCTSNTKMDGVRSTWSPYVVRWRLDAIGKRHRP
jgi:hypothetical protein